MEPLSISLLLALAGGAAGGAGQAAWTSLGALVRRPFQRGESDPAPTGEPEWDDLARSPADQDRAQALAFALAMRARADADFARELASWRQQAETARTGTGDVHNTISGGNQGVVLQARDVHGPLHLGNPGPGQNPRDGEAG
ncbi:hypothetical protein [Streptomyces sp. NPDC048172]|uniref:hypothetical protein n=1 Tax=Streptomyces sp. NPDC048172 TaxID=3365505 RepID=UPI00371275C0